MLRVKNQDARLKAFSVARSGISQYSRIDFAAEGRRRQGGSSFGGGSSGTDYTSTYGSGGGSSNGW